MGKEVVGYYAVNVIHYGYGESIPGESASSPQRSGASAIGENPTLGGQGQYRRACRVASR
jgi:hypothetical protein